MKKSGLVKRLHDKHKDMPREQLEKSVALIHQKISSVLAENGRVEIRGFGTFFLSKRAESTVRNPLTGKSFDVPARQIPRFKAGKNLKKNIDSKAAKPV